MVLPQVVRDSDRAAEQSEEQRRGRFSHLLKPIRDLAENFSIDLAAELEDYLEELEGIEISFHDEASDATRTLNFAEAALLIRGSSLIYSKKVDYLYELVFKVLDTVCAQRDKRIRVDLHDDVDAGEDSPGSQLGDGAVSGTAADLVSAFLSLDDVALDPKANIGSSSTVDGGSETKLSAPEWEVDKRRAEAMQFAPPLAFLHAVEAQVQSGGDAASSFQLSVSQVHASGALLINPSAETNYNVLSDHTTALCAAGETYTSALRDILHVHTSAEAFGDSSEGGNFDDGGAEGAGEFFDDDHNVGGSFGDFDDIGGIGGGLDLAAGYNGSLAASGRFDKPVSKQLFGKSSEVANEVNEEEKIDYWKMHNPHDDSDANMRPFRMGKTFSVPDLSVAHVLPQGPVIASLLISDTVASSSSSSSVASREFGYILRVAKKIKKAVAKRRKQARTLLRAASATTAINTDGSVVKDYEEDAAAVAAQAAAASDGDVDISVAGVSVLEGCGGNFEHDYGDGGFGGTFDDDYGDAFGPSNDGPEGSSADGGAFTTFGGEFHHEQFSEDLDGEGQDMYNSSYAQLCKSHAWEDKLLPVLRDQHSRPRFDIHEYGTRLLDTLSLEVAKKVHSEQMREEVRSGIDSEQADGSGSQNEGGEEVHGDTALSEPFTAIAAKQQASQYEVCRLFLSMLQLANDRNVELSHETVNSEGMRDLPSLDAVADRLTDSLRVKLLSVVKAVDLYDQPGVDHSSMSADLDDDVRFVTQVTQEQDVGLQHEHTHDLPKGSQSSSSGSVGEGDGSKIFDEELAQDDHSAVSGPATSKAIRKRSAMGNLMNQSVPARF
eukprot:g475.t1